MTISYISHSGILSLLRKEWLYSQMFYKKHLQSTLTEIPKPMEVVGNTARAKDFQEILS